MNYISVTDLAAQCGISPEMIRVYIRQSPPLLSAERRSSRGGGVFEYAIPEDAAAEFIAWRAQWRRGAPPRKLADMVGTAELADRLCLTPSAVRYHLRRANFARALRVFGWRTYLDTEEADQFVAWYLSAERESGARFPSLQAEGNGQ